jgi:hypothetical protein
MRSVDEFIFEAQGVKTPQELGQLFHKAMQEEGYENMAFVRVRKQRMDKHLWFHVPPGLFETYVELGFEKHDVILKRIEELQGYLHWDDIENRFQLTEDEKRVSEVCRELGLYSGASFAFRSPDNCCEMFDVSMRQKESPDRKRLEFVRAKLACVHSRYWDLVACQAPQINSDRMIHPNAPGAMTAAHCRALVLTEIAARRWELDLIQLNMKLTAIAGEREIEDLLSWGMITEQSDEERFKFYYAPTLLGLHHLRDCGFVPELRRSIWLTDVSRSEMPVP